MSTTSEGIPLFDVGDPVAPLQALLNAQSNALNAAIISERAKPVGAERLPLATDEQAGISERASQFEVDQADSERFVTGETLFGRKARDGEAHRMAAGVVNVGTSIQTFNFPTGRFSLPPIVTTQLVTTSGTALTTSALVTEVTKTGFSARLSGSGVTFPVHWHAIQMTEGSASG